MHLGQNIRKRICALHIFERLHFSLAILQRSAITKSSKSDIEPIVAHPMAVEPRQTLLS